MLNKEELGEAARTAFIREVKRTVDFLADGCWDQNLRAHLDDLMKLVDAAKEMGVLGSSVPHLETEELDELEKDLRPLRALKMVPEAKAHIIKFLVGHGIPPLTFASKASEVSQE